MADDKDEIVIKGKFKDGQGKEHDIEIDIQKGKKKKKDKHRKPDRIHIKIDGNELTPFFHQGDKKEKDGDDQDDEPKAGDGAEIEWITTEKNKIGGSTGVASGFALKVHCPEKDKPGDEPYIIIEVPESARKKAKKHEGEEIPGIGKIPPLPEEFRVKITEDDQTKINKYLDDPELPRRLF
jgi:hypothetical protein